MHAPILVIHGTNDSVIPIALGKALFDAAPEPKQMAVIQGAGHSDIYAFGAFPRLEEFLRAHLGERTTRAAPDR